LGNHGLSDGFGASDGLGARLGNGLDWLRHIFTFSFSFTTTTGMSECTCGTIVTTDLAELLVVFEWFIVEFLECAQQSLPPLHGC
jgi:hypothetical protein